MIRQLSGIYLILDGAMMPDTEATLAGALLAGVRVFQYREKRGCDIQLLRALYTRTQNAGALLLVNDEVELADMVDGLHVGQDDLQKTSLAALRRRFPEKIIGVSAHTIAQAQASFAADYLGVGPLHSTRTKAIDRPVLEFDGIAAIANVSPLPICAIGGISSADIPHLRAHSIAMAAVISNVARAADPFAASLALVQAWNAPM